jgi:hypothetical protein
LFAHGATNTRSGFQKGYGNFRREAIVKIKVPQDQAETVISSLKHRFPQIEVKYTLKDPPGQKLLKIKNVLEREIVDFVKLFKDIKFCFETDDYPEKEEIAMTEPNQKPKGKFAETMLLALAELENEAQERTRATLENIEKMRAQTEAAAKKFQEDAAQKLREIDSTVQAKFKDQDQKIADAASRASTLTDRVTKAEGRILAGSKALGA